MITLQNFLAPEPGICTEQSLYHREQGVVGFSYDSGAYVIPRSSRLSFKTYFNIFNLDSWRDCALDGLFLELNGTGEVELQVTHSPTGRSDEVVHRTVVTLQPDTPYVVDLSRFHGAGGVLSLSLTAIGDQVRLHAARFATQSPPDTLPDLTVSITTFKREAEVQETVARLQAFLQSFPLADHIRVQVVDNGQSAEISKSDHVTPYPNRNLGGAGGFARGLLEAEAAGASHCLFMDDDASFHMENIARTYMMLAFARDPKTAVAGAMINTTNKWAIWESGAWFDGACRPLWGGTNLRSSAQMMRMQHAVNDPKPATLYGGWWFFAFPIAAVKHYPFPFFVRGDDISFSIANDFHIQTLNGVVSFQDDFTEKESAQTLYLDLRNHIHHHLVFDSLSRSPLGTAKVPLRFILRSLLRMHYSTAEVQLMAWRDVMSGPEFFDKNIDMSARRGDIKELAADEAWQPIETQPQERRFRNIGRLPRSWRTRLGLLTLNGHLIPFWSRIGSRITLEIKHRGLVYHALGASQVTFVNTNRDKAYTRNHDKRRFFRIVKEAISLTREFCRNYDAIKAAHRKGYAEMASKSYWEKTLDTSE
ncbi:glycosyltransferase [Epibacterium sp. SM1979]|uniref:Glycosyltransferase n=1 Tax=Tritonibacter litoralis TaxID=2662264 RepID=A0A843YDY7_9RHOB|nr:glycosyltransferase [Tritonibacter litoralis]MQQ09610.1 glycosyltransferase [Tritonibacter litoralis]